MSRASHKKVTDAFNELNSILDKKRDSYLEKISSTINKAVKKSDDKKLWKESYNKIVDLIYAALTDTYLETVTALRNIYINISDETLNIEDFIYKDDGITLPQRVKKYWDEAAQLLKSPETDTQKISSYLKNPEIDTQEISLYSLNMYDRILDNEMQNIKTGVKEAKKPENIDNLIPIIEIIHRDNCECETCNLLEGFYLEDDCPELPPFHVRCGCDYNYDFYDPNDPQDLEILQEAGWEEDDG